MGTRQRGFSVVEVLLVLVIIGLMGFIGWQVWKVQDRAVVTGKSVTIIVRG